MKPLRAITIVLIILIGLGAANLHADVNTTLTFSNFTDEELYVELSIDDAIG